MFDKDFWGEIISVYTDVDAQEDGTLLNISRLGVKFNGRIINRVTVGASAAIDLENLQEVITKINLQFIADNSTFDGEGFDAWGIFQPDPRFGNGKLWLVSNEVNGYTLMLPEEY